MDRFVLTLTLFACATASIALGLRILTRTAVWVTGGMIVLFPFLSDTSDWNHWFDWAKRYSVVIPVFLLAVVRHRPEHPASQLIARAMPAVLIINILEGAALDLFGPSPVNGVCLLLVAVLVPLRFTWDEPTRQLGFRDPLWQAATLLALSRLYVMNPLFENMVAGALLVLWLTSLACLLERDSQGYVMWRAYTLYGLILQDSILPGLSELVYPDWIHPENRLRLHGTVAGNLWLAVNVGLVALVVVRRLRAWQTRGDGGRKSV